MTDGGRAVCLTCTVRWSRTSPFRPVREPVRPPVRINPWHPSVMGKARTGRAG
jgi:hypothetical protein